MAKKIFFSKEELQKLPASQNQAISQGTKFFYPGKKCSKGHLTFWNTKKNKCVECLREKGRVEAEKLRRKKGQSKMKTEKPITPNEKNNYLTATGRMKRMWKENYKHPRYVKYHEVTCSCGQKIWITKEFWKKQVSCRKCADKYTGLKNTKHGLSHENIYVIYHAAKGRAKKNKLPFNLSIEDIFCPEFCPVLNIKIDYRKFKGTGRAAIDNSPSLDRIDPSKGYTKGNVLLISHRANNIKKDGTYDEHIKIAEFLEKYESKISR